MAARGMRCLAVLGLLLCVTKLGYPLPGVLEFNQMQPGEYARNPPKKDLYVESRAPPKKRAQPHLPPKDEVPAKKPIIPDKEILRVRKAQAEVSNKQSGSSAVLPPPRQVELPSEKPGPNQDESFDPSSIRNGTANSLPDYCETSVCIPLCCPPNTRFSPHECIATNETFAFPPVYDSATLALTNHTFNEENFRFFVWDPCVDGDKFMYDPEGDSNDQFKMLDNGSIYLVNLEEDNILHNGNYCLASQKNNIYEVVGCFIGADYSEINSDNSTDEEIPIAYPLSMCISVPFLVATFLVYTIIPELRNMHGDTLRCHVAVLIVSYIGLIIVQVVPEEKIPAQLCVALAFIIHFSFLSSFFWLNVMCFDIWWTFGGFRSLQGSAKQRERKKFTLYSIYAWGSASLITGICILMDYLPSIPDNFIKPEFGVESCWFNTDAARAIYFYGPMGVTVFCNICLFISTAIKIGQHKKDTAHHLKSSESRRHDDNKQWFNLYLKLFIVMGINWSMEIISWLCKGPQYVWYITDLPNSLQGLIIFIIFVWKDKIKRLLLKRFGCHERNFLSRNSTRSVYNSSASRTCTTSAPLQEKTNPFVSEANRTKIVSEESDCA